MKSLYLIILLNIFSSTKISAIECNEENGVHKTAPGFCVICKNGAVFSGKGCKCVDANKKLVKTDEISRYSIFGAPHVDFWECQ